MKRQQAKISALRAMLGLGTALLLSGCAIFDVVPESGYPEARNAESPAPSLEYWENYEFHDNPRL